MSVDWDLVRFVVDAALAGFGGYMGVRIAVARLETKQQHTDAEMEKVRETLHHLRGDINRNGNRITVCEAKLGVHYREN